MQGLFFAAVGLSRPKSRRRALTGCRPPYAISGAARPYFRAAVPEPLAFFREADQYLLSLSTVLGDTMPRRKRSPAYRRSYYPANDNRRWTPRIVPYSYAPAVRNRGRFAFRALALAMALGQAGRSRYLGHPATRSVLALEDRRRWHPAGALAPAGALSRSARGLVLAGSEGSGLGSAVRFRSPVKVSICVRRKVRREVIMAKGKGGGGHRPPTRNYWSDVQC